MIEIDRLAIRMEGTTAASGRRLANALARRLAEKQFPTTSRSIESVEIELDGRDHESTDALAERIAVELVRILGERQ